MTDLDKLAALGRELKTELQDAHGLAASCLEGNEAVFNPAANHRMLAAKYRHIAELFDGVAELYEG